MPGLYRTPEEKRQLETRNGVIQFHAVLYYAERWKEEGAKLAPPLLLELQRLAVNQNYSSAGSFRDGPVVIKGAGHAPPSHETVEQLVGEMCDYVNQNWDGCLPAHLSAYLMWRLNWIHPFFGGNGRTSRAIAYLVLCAKLGFRIPGEKTIPDLIVEDRGPYYAALRTADDAWSRGTLDISDMTSLMSSLLAKQLVMVHRQACGDAPA